MQYLISWKHSFRRLGEEYEVATKKKKALDNLLSTGRISQPTHDMFNREISEAIADIEKQEKALLEKMAAKVVELEGQVQTLEVLLANFEIRHVTGEIDEEVYRRENDLLSMGLEVARQELDEVKEAADQLAGGDLTLDRDVEQQKESEAAEPEVKFLDETPPTEEKETAEHHEETVVEAVTCKEESGQKTECSVEDKQKA